MEPVSNMHDHDCGPSSAVRQAQEDLLRVQREMITVLQQENDWLLRERIRIARHMERCSNVGETNRARWEDARFRMQALQQTVQANRERRRQE